MRRLLAGTVLCSIAATAPAWAGTFYVIPNHPNASDGNNYYCGSRACVPQNLIGAGYGARDMPFGSLREGVSQVQTYAAAGQSHTIYVAPGLYREHVYMPGARNLHIVADTSGIHTGSTAGAVVVTGSEPLDESGFVEHPSYPGVWGLRNARGPDGQSLCLTPADWPSQTCSVVIVVEAGNADVNLRRTRYLNMNSVADVATGFGRFYADIDHANPNLPVDLYVRTHDGSPPTAALGLEYVLGAGGNGTRDVYYRHRHCFDMEVGAAGNTIEGFTCRYTSSYGIHAAMASNTIRGNEVYGCNFAGIEVGYFTVAGSSSSAIVEGNTVSHCNFGVRVQQREYDTHIRNNVIHHNNIDGLLVDVSAPGSGGTAAVFAANNTLHANGQNLRVVGLADVVAINNSISDGLIGQYDVATTGSGEMTHNNVSGAIAPGPSTLPVSNETAHAPSYRDPANFDFHLQATSALIDAGTSGTIGGGTSYEYSLTSDDGDFLPRAAPYDLGAFEFSTVGDGIIDSGESCDDGDRDSGDGCDAAGQIETTYVFQGPLYATDSSCDCVYSVAGNGTKTPLKKLNAASPVSMAVTGKGVLVVVDNQTGTLGSYNPDTGARRVLCTGLPTTASLAISPVDLPGPGLTFPAGTLFGANEFLFAIVPGNCSRLDLGPIGPSGTEAIGGLDFRSDGTLFGAQLSSLGLAESLFTIDTATGQGTAVGTIGPGFFDRVGSLVFDAEGVLWATDINAASPRLVRLNPTDASIVHAIPLPVLPVGQPWTPQGLGVVKPEN